MAARVRLNAPGSSGPPRPAAPASSAPSAPPAPPAPRQFGEVTFVTDPSGRRIGFKSLNALERLRVFKAIGAIVGESNAAYLGMSLLASAMRQIDEELIVFPRSELDIETIIAQLGDEGINAITDSLNESMGDDGAALAKK
jgi:hypothetical protein